MVIKYSDKPDICLTKDHFEQLISCDGTDFKLCHKVTQSHLDVKGVERQRVRPAMELFSDSVSQAFRQIFGSQAEGHAQVIGIIDSFVDIMNSRFKFDFSKDNRCGFGKLQCLLLFILGLKNPYTFWL